MRRGLFPFPERILEASWAGPAAPPTAGGWATPVRAVGRTLGTGLQYALRSARRSARRTALAVSPLLAAATSLQAQPGLGLGDVVILSKSIAARAWTVENGLPQSSVTELHLDSRGYIWGATFGGLFRFDGRTVRQYTSADLPYVTSNSVSAMEVLRTGDLLVGTPAGTIVRVRDGRTVDSLPASGKPAAINGVDGISETRDGSVWVRRAESVQRYRHGRWEAPLPYKGVTALLEDGEGRLLFGGPSGIVRVEASGVAHRVASQPALPLGAEFGAHLDARGRVWLGSPNGLWLHDSEGEARKVVATTDTVNVILSDSTGTLWFGAGEKLYRYDPDKPTAAPELLLDAKARLVSMAMTRDGLLVLGTLEGMLLIRRNAINVLDVRRAVPAVETGSIISAADSTVWVTSSCSDALRITRRGEVLDSIPRANPLGCTRSLHIDARLRIWAGGDGAIRRRTPGGADQRWQVDTLPPGEALVRPLLSFGDSLVFGLSDGRVGVIGPDDRLTFLPGWTERTGRAVESMARAVDGTLWVAQKGRLSRISQMRTVRYDQLAGIPDAVPRALYTDPNGGVWIGTYGAGLWFFREGTMARSAPVIDQTISAIFEGTSGGLWMPGNRGLTILSMRTLREWVLDSTRVPDLRLLSYNEGVPEGNLGYPAATRLADGVLAFSSVTGLVVVHAPGIVTSGVTPPLHLDDLRSPVGPLAVRDGYHVVMPEARAVTASFSMPSFRFGEVAQFRYRLSDGPWILLGNTRDLQLTLPRPGRYRLELEGRVPGGEWVRSAPVLFEVTPLFAELQWPRWVLGLLVASLVVVLARQRVRTQQLAARTLEIELRARRDAALLAEQHQREMAQVGRVAVAGELTASLSHELGQPLAAIVNNAEVARRLLSRTAPGGGDARIEQALLDVVAQGRRASQVVREFRRFLKRERGEREPIGVRELIDSVTVLLRQEYEAQRVALQVIVAAETPAIEAERVLLQQVLVNLLSNALEATRRVRGGQVLVRARPCGDGVRVTVVDNGAGFAADVRRSAFEPFVTTRENGMGMGLAIARRVVEAHGGRIAVGHLATAGAVVSLWLPTSHMPFDRSDSLVPLQVTAHE